MIDKYVKMTYNIELEKVAKSLKKIPKHIRFKFYDWVKSLSEIGIQETRKQKGFHDEPLKGERLGQRSVRLSRSYRAIYKVNKPTRTIEVLEVSKHEY